MRGCRGSAYDDLLSTTRNPRTITKLRGLAFEAREQDLAAPAARRRLLAAERRLGVAVERGRVEDG